ncbi:MAG: hypothetical protein JST00_11790 [Deltaproteobacteria bacterium]|nr:hypothetical protein [Deltaproteobacteria bacterium]
MAYLFSLTGTRPGEPRTAVNPFTGEPGLYTPFVMSDEQHAAVVAVIKGHGGVVEAGTGRLAASGAELRFDDLGGPRCRVTIEGAIEPAIAVLFEIATAARVVVMNEHEACDEPVPVVTTAEAHAQAVASAFQDYPPELVDDVGRFLRVLLPGYDRMRAHDAS